MSKKLDLLAELEGFDSADELLFFYGNLDYTPGICTEEDCDHTAEVIYCEYKGWCEFCNKSSVKSAIVLSEET